MERIIIAYHPWEHIKEELEARGRSQKQFAELLGVAPNEVNDLIKGRRNVTAIRAMKIGKAFGQSAEMRLWIQNYYDIYLASKNENQYKLLQEIGVRREAMAFAF